MRPPGPSSSVARTPGRATAALTLLTVLLTVLLTALLTGCGATIPTDPDGTLATVRGGTLRVGVSLDEPWTVLEPVDPDDPQAQDPAVRPAGTGMRPAGIEPELVTEFARTLDADVTWTLGGEQTLVAALEEGELDLVVGGLTSTSPQAQHAALTVGYATVRGPHGTDELHVMAVPAGENAFLVELERFLLDHQEVG